MKIREPEKPPPPPYSDTRWQVFEFTDLRGRKRYKVRRGPFVIHSEWTGAHWRTRSLSRARRVRDKRNRALDARAGGKEQVVE